MPHALFCLCPHSCNAPQRSTLQLRCSCMPHWAASHRIDNGICTRFLACKRACKRPASGGQASVLLGLLGAAFHKQPMQSHRDLGPAVASPSISINNHTLIP